ncbi:MAG: class I SAM-dependent rRNA methyltransferase [Alphaproteobacteria bacterium]|nr:class I SAM-dependent rRNA methyltransferase [Alphaproteobacteria bacterium]
MTALAETVPDIPEIRLQAGRHKRARQGHPWVYSNEVEMDAAAKSLPPGGLVRLVDASGNALGIATFNPHPLISARILSRDPADEIDAGFLTRRLAAARDIREALYGVPFYRLVHAEADGLPGLIVDRFGDICVVQVNTAGMELLTPALTEALHTVLSPKTIVFRNDSAVRRLEGLPQETRIEGTPLDGPIEVLENGAVFYADPREGQKTGWFYDQRDNRAFSAALSKGKRVADFYSFSGGFGVAAAMAGAQEVHAFDRSQAALDLAARAAETNGVGDRFTTTKGDVFPLLHRATDAGETWDVVVADPPAFVKSKKDYQAGIRGYRKLFRLAAQAVAPGGIFVAASCSHHVDMPSFGDVVRRALADTGRTGRILRSAGAAPDHPVHPFLPETGYLKAQVLQLD